MQDPEVYYRKKFQFKETLDKAVSEGKSVDEIFKILIKL